MSRILTRWNLCAPLRWRLSAGRQSMSDAVQALCFVADANSIFYGEKLLTTGKPDVRRMARCCSAWG